MFYNVENFFDPYYDSASNYNEFTEKGVRHWNYTKYSDKRDKIYQLISAIGEWQSPAMIAFAEIENRYVLENMIRATPLKEQGYGVVHFDSEDERGIDVGVIYLKNLLKPVITKPIKIEFPEDPSNKTRDILYIKSVLFGDTLHIFINHWPSRYGGVLETESYRMAASKVLKGKIDSLCIIHSNPNILVMGDFNDNPGNESIQALLSGNSNCLQQLPVKFSDNLAKGSYKYRAKWENYDQVFSSLSLIHGDGNIKLIPNSYIIFDAQFLLESDQKYHGLKPYRTFIGYNYNGGFSDHLPVYIDIYTIKSE